MITVSVKGVKKRDAYYEWSGVEHVLVVIIGHAEFAEKGSDIVCAGVSALIQALSRSIASKGIEQNVLSADGLMEIMFSWKDLKEREREFILSSLDVIIYGLIAMEKQYPGKIKITIEE